MLLSRDAADRFTVPLSFRPVFRRQYRYFTGIYNRGRRTNDAKFHQTRFIEKRLLKHVASPFKRCYADSRALNFRVPIELSLSALFEIPGKPDYRSLRPIPNQPPAFSFAVSSVSLIFPESELRACTRSKAPTVTTSAPYFAAFAVSA